MFLPGLVPFIGFSAGFVQYVRQRRSDRAPTTIRHLTRRALDALTSFSTIPIDAVLVMALAAWSVPVLISGWMLVNFLLKGQPPTLAVTLVLSGVVAWCATISVLAVIAHYVGRIFLEVKRRPRYFVKRVVDKSDHG